MTSKQRAKNGGPAFPHTYTVGRDLCSSHNEGDQIDFPGMTLRDWFAGQALAGLCASRAPELVGLPKFALAEDAYLAADAMLHRRDQQPPTRE